MLNVQRATATLTALREIDAQLAVEEYPPDRDRLLDERRDLERYLVALQAGLVPNG